MTHFPDHYAELAPYAFFLWDYSQDIVNKPRTVDKLKASQLQTYYVRPEMILQVMEHFGKRLQNVLKMKVIIYTIKDLKNNKGVDRQTLLRKRKVYTRNNISNYFYQAYQAINARVAQPRSSGKQKLLNLNKQVIKK